MRERNPNEGISSKGKNAASRDPTSAPSDCGSTGMRPNLRLSVDPQNRETSGVYLAASYVVAANWTGQQDTYGAEHAL